MAGRHRILRHNSRILSIALTAVFLLFLSPSSPCYAAKLYFPEVKERLVAYGIQIAELGSDLAAVSAWRSAIENMDTQAKDFAKWRHVAYEDDHWTAKNGLEHVKDPRGADYAENFKGGGGYGSVMPGYRTISAGGPTHAKLYEQRVTAWRARIKEMLSGNKYALDDILNCQARIGEIMNEARKVRGYIRRADEAAYLEVLLDDEMSKLNSDVDRRLAMETEIALNEQLERSDAVAAYALAVGSWKPPVNGVNY